MKVKDFLMSSFTTGTTIEVSDVLFYGQVFFRGSVREYIDSDEEIVENLIFVSSGVKGNVLYVEAELDLKENKSKSKSLLSQARENTYSHQDKQLNFTIEGIDKDILKYSSDGFGGLVVHLEEDEVWMDDSLREHYEKNGFRIVNENKNKFTIRWSEFGR